MSGFKVEDVVSVYSGKAGKCACGCSGKHRYAAAHRALAGERRGYAVADDEVNDRQVRKVANLVAGAGALLVSDGDGVFYAELDGRLYVVYTKDAK